MSSDPSISKPSKKSKKSKEEKEQDLLEMMKHTYSNGDYYKGKCIKNEDGDPDAPYLKPNANQQPHS